MKHVELIFLSAPPKLCFINAVVLENIIIYQRYCSWSTLNFGTISTNLLPTVNGQADCRWMSSENNRWCGIHLLWRRLVNAYEVKAGMVHLHGKNYVIRTWSLQRWAHYEALYNRLLPLHFSSVPDFGAYRVHWVLRNIGLNCTWIKILFLHRLRLLYPRSHKCSKNKKIRCSLRWFYTPLSKWWHRPGWFQGRVIGVAIPHPNYGTLKYRKSLIRSSRLLSLHRLVFDARLLFKAELGRPIIKLDPPRPVFKERLVFKDSRYYEWMNEWCFY